MIVRPHSKIMPRLACPCGFVHNLSPIPDDGWVAIRDRDFEPLLDAEVRRREIEAGAGGTLPPKTHPKFEEWQKSDLFISAAHSRFFECPNCGRLMWRRDGRSTYTIYTKEI